MADRVITSGRRGMVMVGRELRENEWSAAVSQGDRPRHYAFELASSLNLDVVSTADIEPTRRDWLFSLLIARPHVWALARMAARRSHGEEFVYATDETLGIPFLLAGRDRKKKARSLAMFVMAPYRRRTRFWFQVLKRFDLLPATIVVGLADARDAMIEQIGTDGINYLIMPFTIDDEFFHPPTEPLPARERPLVISAGLEQRDYRRLADAVRGLDVDVQVCAVSPDLASANTVMPDDVPPNMTFTPLSIADLRDLYQRADLFVLSTVDNGLWAGLTAVIEALACGTDVVLSTGKPDLDDLAALGLATSAANTSPAALRTAIVEALADRDRSTTMATKVAKKRLSADDYVLALGNHFTALGHTPEVSVPVRPPAPQSTSGAATAAEATIPDISIVVPVGRVDESLRLQLDALLSQDPSVSYEIILSHNMPKPAGRRTLSRMMRQISDRRVRVVEAFGLASAAHARNVGALAARAQLLAFCDADDVVHPGWIDAMVAGLHDYDAITGMTFEIAPSGQEDWRPPATPNALPEFHGAPYVLSGNLGIRRAAFTDVGGFDESLTRCEDIAIGWTLQNRGHTVGFAPDAMLDYHHRAGFRNMLRQHYLYGKGMAEVLKKYPNPTVAADGAKDSPLRLLKPNSQPHRRTVISESRRAAIGLGRLVGLAGRG